MARSTDARGFGVVEVARVECAMGPSRRKDDLVKFLAEMRADADARADALAIIEAWNLRLTEGRPLFFSSTLGAALVAERPWLAVECGGCLQTAAIDCRTLLYDRDRAISSLLSLLTCGRCGRGTRVGLRGLSQWQSRCEG
jgi:hypothetical protein